MSYSPQIILHLLPNSDIGIQILTVLVIKLYYFLSAAFESNTYFSKLEAAFFFRILHFFIKLMDLMIINIICMKNVRMFFVANTMWSTFKSQFPLKIISQTIQTASEQ